MAQYSKPTLRTVQSEKPDYSSPQMKQGRTSVAHGQQTLVRADDNNSGRDYTIRAQPLGCIISAD